VAGRPTLLLTGRQQHAFVRGTSGTVEHCFWDPTLGGGFGLAPVAAHHRGTTHCHLAQLTACDLGVLGIEDPDFDTSPRDAGLT
jgi:hypothetical protein